MDFDDRTFKDGSKQWWINGQLIKKSSPLHRALEDIGMEF